jgi:hypothetical protein
MEEAPMVPSTGVAEHLGNSASPRHRPQGCRFGASTLDMAYPDWLSAWDSPWSCCHIAHPGPLETVEACATCPDWTSRNDPDARRIPPS